MRLTEQHEQEVDDSDNALLCHGVQWKVVDGVLEDWRCMARFGAHAHLVGYDVICIYSLIFVAVLLVYIIRHMKVATF